MYSLSMIVINFVIAMLTIGSFFPINFFCIEVLCVVNSTNFV